MTISSILKHDLIHILTLNCYTYIPGLYSKYILYCQATQRDNLTLSCILQRNHFQFPIQESIPLETVTALLPLQWALL